MNTITYYEDFNSYYKSCIIVDFEENKTTPVHGESYNTVIINFMKNNKGVDVTWYNNKKTVDVATYFPSISLDVEEKNRFLKEQVDKLIWGE